MAKSHKSNPDHVRRRNMPAPSSEVIEAHLSELLKPLIDNQKQYYRQLGMRSRVLTLSAMVAVLVTMLLRQVPSVRELARILARENILWWCSLKVSQQALSQRFLAFPAELLRRLLIDLVSVLQQRWQHRQQRPLPASMVWATEHFERVWIVDGSTLEALFRKLDSLRDYSKKLAGKIYTIIDGASYLPVEVRVLENPYAADPSQWDWLKAQLLPQTLVIFDRGFYDLDDFAAVVAQGCAWITRLKKSTFTPLKTFSQTPGLIDQLIRLGSPSSKAKPMVVRLIRIRHSQSWYSYITSVTDPNVLPPYVVGDLYCRRWHIETAFNLVKRLLGLGYLWTGSLNGVKLQVWVTWLFYAVLLDICDDIADELGLPTERISCEMVFRGFYHFHHAQCRGVSQDIKAFFSDPANGDLGVVKPIRKRRRKEALNLSPFPT